MLIRLPKLAFLKRLGLTALRDPLLQCFLGEQVGRKLETKLPPTQKIEKVTKQIHLIS